MEAEEDGGAEAEEDGGDAVPRSRGSEAAEKLSPWLREMSAACLSACFLPSSLPPSFPSFLPVLPFLRQGPL